MDPSVARRRGRGRLTRRRVLALIALCVVLVGLRIVMKRDHRPDPSQLGSVADPSRAWTIRYRSLRNGLDEDVDGRVVTIRFDPRTGETASRRGPWRDTEEVDLNPGTTAAIDRDKGMILTWDLLEPYPNLPASCPYYQRVGARLPNGVAWMFCFKNGHMAALHARPGARRWIRQDSRIVRATPNVFDLVRPPQAVQPTGSG